MAEERKFNPGEIVAKKFMRELANGTSPLLAAQSNAPINGVSGQPFSAINRLYLSSNNADNRWFNKNQAEYSGFELKNEAQGQHVVVWELTQEEVLFDDRGEMVFGADGRPVIEIVECDRPLIRFETVYQADELRLENGQPLPVYEPLIEDFNVNKLPGLIEASGINIVHDQKQGRTFYRGHDDSFHMMPEADYPNRPTYAADIVQGLVRASRHKNRLNRPCGPHGSEDYAREELRVALAAMMISQDLNLPFSLDQNKNYAKSWVEILKKDPYELARACRDAEQIKGYVMGLDQEKNVERPAEPLEYFQVTAYRRAVTADGDQALPWAKAEGDDQALFFAVESTRDGSLVHTFSDRGSAESEALSYSFAMNRDTPLPAPLTSPGKIFLEVPFLEKNIVKELGATWDNGRKSWCARPGVNLKVLSRWIPQQERENIAPEQFPLFKHQQTGPELAAEKTFLKVPYSEKEAAKLLGAKWDSEAKLWFAPVGTDLVKIAKWIPENEPVPAPNLSPVDEFAKTLEQAGLKLSGPPVMDGKIQRVTVEGGKGGSLDGSYCAYLDGRPNGWLQNHKTGQKIKWLATGQVLSEEQKTALKLEAAEKLARRGTERAALQAQAIEKASENFSMTHRDLHLLSDNYLERKGVFNHHRANELGDYLLSDIRCEENTAKIFIPAYDQDGQLQTVQSIGPDGQKNFAKGCPKAGAMHIIDPHVKMVGEWVPHLEQEIVEPRTIYPSKLAEISNPAEILIAEGYATGASLHLATGKPVAVAFDAGNLKAAALIIRENFPQASIIICADNDHHLDKNVGLEKADKAAQAVGGKVVSPVFTPEEKAAGLTDFNDLHQARGLSAVAETIDRQLGQGPQKNLFSSVKERLGMGQSKNEGRELSR